MSRNHLAEIGEAIRALPRDLDAACAGVTEEFIDVAPIDARRILDAYCLAGCDVIAACRRLGDQGAPYKYPVIYGGRYYATDEPADGWEISA